MSVHSALGISDASVATRNSVDADSPLKVSVIVPCRNEIRNIDSFIESLLRQEQEGLDVEVIIADGMSTDGTRAKLEYYSSKYPFICFIDNPSQIVSGGLNAAILASCGDVIVRMDVHTEYKSDYIRRCVEALEETGADNVGGACIAVGEGYLGRAVAAAFQSAFAVGGARWHRPSYVGPADTVHLGCWRRKVIQQAGLFDETLVRNQDDELNLRMTRAGLTVWQSPKIVSWYHPRSSLKALFKQYSQYGYWKVAVIRKHRIPASWRHLVPGIFVLANLMALLTVGLRMVAGFTSLPWFASSMAVADVLYLALNFAASLGVAAKKGWSLLPVLPLVFLTYHIAYGAGFLSGLFYFSPLGKSSPSGEGVFTSLTR